MNRGHQKIKKAKFIIAPAAKEKPLLQSNSNWPVAQLREDIIHAVGLTALSDLKFFLEGLPLDANNKRALKYKLEGLERIELKEVLSRVWGKNFGFALGGEAIHLHLDIVNGLSEFLLLLRERLEKTYADHGQNIFMVGLYDKDCQRLDLYYPGWNPEELFSDILKEEINNFGLNFELRNYKGKVLLEIKFPTYGKKEAFIKFSFRNNFYAVAAHLVQRVQFLTQVPREKIWIPYNGGVKIIDTFPPEGQLGIKLLMEDKKYHWVLADDIQGKFYDEYFENNQNVQTKVVDEQLTTFIYRLQANGLFLAS